MKSLYFALLISLACIQAMASDTPSGCAQPIIPAAQASDVINKLFDKRHKAYKACIDKFVEEKQAISKNAADVPTANAAHDAVGAAIKEYNDFIAALNERNASLGQDDDDEDSAKTPGVPSSQPPPSKH
jgi:hypothetical protein